MSAISTKNNTSCKPILKKPYKYVPKTQASKLLSLKTKNINGYNAKKILNNNGITIGKKIAKTLQGSIYHGKLEMINDSMHDIVVKRADIRLLKRRIARLGNGKIIPINEDIKQETTIMKYIQGLNPPKGFLKVFGCIDDGYNYFLIMEYGGKSLFDHVRKYHKKIDENKLSINEWQKHVEILFKQLISMTNFLHNKARICHMDISLENILIKNCVFAEQYGKFTSHGQLYFCDFGLAQYFDNTNPNFISGKYVGKTSYQAPEVYSKKTIFDARKADIWSLGICLFMLQLGLQPLNEPTMKDAYFRNIIHGHLSTMIHQNGKINYSSKWFIFYINNMLTLHKRRWDINMLFNALFQSDKL